MTAAILSTFDPEALTIVTNKTRKLYDPRGEEPFDPQLVESIQVEGVTVPVIVWKHPKTGEYEVVDGRRRVTACREVNRRIATEGLAEGGIPLQVPAIVRQAVSEEQLIAIMIITNELRKADKPSNRAEKLRKLVDMGKSEAEVASICGRSVAFVKQTLALLDCTGTVRAAVDSRKISIANASELAKFHPAEQKAKLAQVIALLAKTGGVPNEDDGSGGGKVNGIKRNGRGRRIKEIVRGKPMMLGKRQILNLKETFAEAGYVKPHDKAIILAVLDRVLGDKKPLNDLLG